MQVWDFSDVVDLTRPQTLCGRLIQIPQFGQVLVGSHLCDRTYMVVDEKQVSRTIVIHTFVDLLTGLIYPVSNLYLDIPHVRELQHHSSQIVDALEMGITNIVIGDVTDFCVEQQRGCLFIDTDDVNVFLVLTGFNLTKLEYLTVHKLPGVTHIPERATRSKSLKKVVWTL